ncbi:MAG: HD domain-containing protein [Spirochaetes bacterium]|nr:HD domain-containing protein [Spirochaetota bacterium]
MTKSAAIQLLESVRGQNPGPWIAHSYYVAQAAEIIANQINELDSTKAYCCGLLHDIGRKNGPYHLKHVLDGYYFLKDLGYLEESIICLTHSFHLGKIEEYLGEQDCSAADIHFLEAFLANYEFNDYDRLIQLCDSLALPKGFCILEMRFVDILQRYPVKNLLPQKWEVIYQIKAYFEKKKKKPLYPLLPDIIYNTFGIAGNFQLHES